MKIKNQKIDRFGFGKVYVMYGGALVSVDITGCVISTNDLSVKYQVVFPNGDTVELDGSRHKFYESPDKFEADEEVPTVYDNTIENILSRYFDISCRLENKKIDGIDYVVATPFCWIFKGGEPVCVEPDILRIVLSLDDKNELVGSNIPEKYYKSRDEVLKWHDYIVEEKDGSRHLHKALLPQIVLTDEQKEAVKAINDAYQKARDLGVRFFWDADNEVQRVINVNNLKEYESDDEYNRSQKKKRGEIAEDDLMKPLGDDIYRPEFRTGISIYDFWLNCDYDLYVKVKEGGE